MNFIDKFVMFVLDKFKIENIELELTINTMIH